MLILPIATYASETWTLRACDTRKLESFEMRCLRTILGVSKRDRIPNAKIRDELNITQTISEHVKEKRLRWFGQVSRRPEQNYVAEAFNGTFTSNRNRGRPPKRWQDQIREDTGLPVATAVKYASDRAKWRGICHKTARGRKSCAV